MMVSADMVNSERKSSSRLLSLTFSCGASLLLYQGSKISLNASHDAAHLLLLCVFQMPKSDRLIISNYSPPNKIKGG